jgi:hypothetical protein
LTCRRAQEATHDTGMIVNNIPRKANITPWYLPDMETEIPTEIQLKT